MQHHDQPIRTEGLVIYWARFYDFMVQIFFLGRERHFRRRIVLAAGLVPGQRVLDVGCGTGTLAVRAAEAVGADGRIYGIDPAPGMIARAREKAAHVGAGVEFTVGVIEALQFPDRSMDVVLCTLVFHHLPDGLKRAGLAEIRRVLVPGGRLVLVDFGSPARLVAEAQTAGFGAIRTARLRPSFVFSLIAESGAQDV